MHLNEPSRCGRAMLAGLMAACLAGCEYASEATIFTRLTGVDASVEGGAQASVEAGSADASLDDAPESADAAETGPTVAPSRLQALSRGVVVNDWIRTSYTRGFLSSTELANLRGVGIRSIRLPFGMPIFFDESNPGVVKSDALGNYDEILDQVMGQGFSVVVAPVDTDERTWTDTTFVPKLVAFWRTFSQHLAARDHERLFIKFDQDPTSSDPSAWYAAQLQLLAVVRDTDPDRTLLVTPNSYTSIGDRDPLKSLLEMVPLDEPNVVYDFGFFAPVTFTLQSANWREPWLAGLHDLPYPSSPEACASVLPNIDPSSRSWADAYCNSRYDRSTLANLLEAASAWSKTNHVPISNSAIGVLKTHVPAQSRIDWLTDVRSLMETQSIPWAYYNDATVFSALTGATGQRTMEAAVATALGLP